MTANRLSFGNKRGIALPLTLGILFILGLLIHSFYLMVSAERYEVARRYEKAKSQFSVWSAVEYAFFHTRRQEEPWRVSDLHYASFDSSVVFSLHSEQEGAFGLLKVATPFQRDSAVFRVGYLPKNLPALTLFDPNATVALAGKAFITGNVAMRNPHVTLSYHYKMPASASAGFRGDTVGSASPVWDSIAFFPEPVREFFENLQIHQNKDCIFDARDTLKGDYSCRRFLMQGDSYCNGCRIFSESVEIRGRALFQNGFAAAHTITVSEETQISGHLIARDTLNIALDESQTGETAYAVLGRKTGPVEYTGFMNVEKFRGKALIFYLGDTWDSSLPGVSAILGDKTEIEGLVFIRGSLDLKGKVRGSVAASHFAFEDSGILWLGYLKDGQIVSDTGVSFLVPDAFRIGGELSYEYR